MIDVGKIYESGFRDGEQSKWTPCSEKMPEEEDRPYMVTYKYNGRLEMSMAHLWSWGNKKEFSLTSIVIPKEKFEVIAWMPLPKPYEG